MTNELISSEWVIMKNKKTVTTSLKIAEIFGKNHKNVLQSIENLMAENSAVRNYFAKDTYKNPRNREYPMYYMNRDGFSLLAMGFTGKEAIEFKIKLIEEFNRMEEYIKQTNESGIALFIPENHKNDPMIQQNMILSQMMNQLTTQRMEFLDFQQKTNKDLEEIKELQEFQVDVSTQKALTLEIKSISRTTGLSEREVRNLIYDKIALISGTDIYKALDKKKLKAQEERKNSGKKPFAESTLKSKFPIYETIQELGLNKTMAQVVYDMKKNYKEYKL